jgi:hypothetical protein
MEFEDVLKVAPGIGIGIGLAIYYSRQRKVAGDLGGKVRAALQGVESMSLPELTVLCGLRDGFMGRGKMLQVLQPMVAAGELVQEEPPGTTVSNRLSVLRFKLAQRKTG